MGFIKYSIGSIADIEDADEVQKIETKNSNAEKVRRVLTCTKCGIQNGIITNSDSITCSCGNIISTN